MAKGGKPGRSFGSRESARQERVRRLMREHDLQAPHRVGHAHLTTEADADMTTTV